MTDIGLVPLMIFMGAYFATYFLRAPQWVQKSIAVPMGLTSLWSLAFGLHIYVPTSVGHPLNRTVPVVMLVCIILGLPFVWRKFRREAAPEEAGK